jgi:uncharacterized protein (DUF934 family)
MPAEPAFVPVEDNYPLPEGRVIVSIARFQKERELLLARGGKLGLRLETSQSPQLIAEDLHKFALIVLHVPYFRDGRAYSWARLLRTRLGYKGEIRVSGHVLKDQVAFYARVGVDSFDLPNAASEADLEAAQGEISHVYQPSVDGRETIWDLRARRRQSTAS